MAFSDFFGFLDHPDILEFNGGQFVPVPEFHEGLEYIRRFGDKDGSIYSLMIKSVEFDSTTMEPVRDVPNSRKPASLFSLPTSHSLDIENPLEKNDLRNGDAAFLVRLLAFFFGASLQFSDWCFDGKIPIKRTNSFCMHLTCRAVLSHMHPSNGESYPIN